MKKIISYFILLSFFLTLTSCKKKVVVRGCMDATATNYNAQATEDDGSCAYAPVTVGQNYKGGIVAYVLHQGDPGYNANVPHGIIAAPSDQSNSIQWSNGSAVATGATGTAIGTGNANTTAIVNSQGAGNYAAKLCYDLVLGGYSDWYLPSQDEVSLLYGNRVLIGGFVLTTYWSSSEDNNSDAEYMTFSNSYWHSGGKSAPYGVRAIRTF